MKKSPTNTPASVLARLKNLSERDHLDFNFLMLRYIQERFLARLAESNVAEKFEAIVKLSSFNSRMKDFYDIDFLSTEFNFEGPLLQSAIQKTFDRRETSLHSAAELLQFDLGKQPGLQNLWRAFVKRTGLLTTDNFDNIFQSTRAFVGPIIDAATAEKPISLNWDRSTKEWR